MTPNNIAKMALLKGLDLIAVTDHNSARQLPAVKAACDGLGVGLLPGLEITTREEVHLLAYFLTVEEALDFSQALYAHLPPVPCRPDFFGPQWVMDHRDEVIAQEDRLLISALDLSIDDLTQDILNRGGLAVPAHINRGASGLLGALGFVPPGAPYSALEVARGLPPPPDKGIARYKILTASDAHQLGDMLEREVFLPLTAPTPEAFFAYIRGGGQ